MAEQSETYNVSIRFDALHIGEGALTLNLLVYPTSAYFGLITGSGEISAAVEPKMPPVHIHQATGMYQTRQNPKTLLVHVTGEYLESVPTPGRGSFVGPFSASCAVDTDWNGEGTFAYGRFQAGRCVVTRTGETSRAEPPLIAAENVPA
jgi:hypothetical protein